ncbi:carbohydrate ABC transporter permease [Companilactobacillus zhongbaensis]|uniref:carbohydrate ABC transporter permease n=1 Tax=Companilactobacillus zhongbaensis TaxID=2486009 RepID=UPI000F78C423|nr:carbohydrate ABC transporter permease [Companilactobacillus zhongbaensis]
MRKSTIGYSISSLLIIVVTLLPIIWCLIISLTPESDMLSSQFQLSSKNVTFGNYQAIFNLSTPQSQTVILGLVNSLKSSILTVIIALPISFITSYALYRYKFRFKKVFIKVLILTLVFPVLTTIVPIYNMFKNLGMLDSMFWTSIIYTSSLLPLITWINLNYLNSISPEIFQAAKIDGFSESQTFFRIAVPLCRPILVTGTLIIFLAIWKQYMIPMILLTTYKNRTLTLILSTFMTRNSIDYGLIAAIGVISIIPPIIIALLFRKFLVNGFSSQA